MLQKISQALDLPRIEAEIQSHPRVRGMVREVFLFDRVDSTNRVALQMGSAGVPGGVLIVAEGQDRGRGRGHRLWVSPKGVNLYLSLLLRPYQPPREFPLFSIATAVALIQAIRKTTSLMAVAKWPNDILLHNKKVAGILLEMGKNGGAEPHLVVGMGININWSADAIPPELSGATSLSIVLGHPVDRNRLLLDLLMALEEQYRLLQTGKKRLLIQALSAACMTLGQAVRVETPRQTLEGVAQAIGEDGSLRLALPDGTVRTVLFGEITHLTTSHAQTGGDF